MKNNVLLVGGAGYIGSVLTEHLLSGGFNVKCFDALIYSQKQNIKKFLKRKNYEFTFGDIRKEALVESSLKKAALWDECKDKLNDSGYSLSGGQQQRLCIARTIAIEPEIYSEWAEGSNLVFRPFIRLDSEDSNRSHIDIREGIYSWYGEDWESSIKNQRQVNCTYFRNYPFVCVSRK